MVKLHSTLNRMNTNFTRNIYSIISCLITGISLICILAINQKIASHYLTSDGKTKALFGMVEYLRFGFKYYLLIPCIIALVLGIVGFKKEKLKTISTLSIFFSCFVIVLIFFQLWKLMI